MIHAMLRFISCIALPSSARPGFTPRLAAFVLALAAMSLSGCSEDISNLADAAAPAFPLGGLFDPVFLAQPMWDDGRAELAFFALTREIKTGGRSVTLRSWAATMLVKQRYNTTHSGKQELVEMHDLDTPEDEVVEAFHWGFIDPAPSPLRHSGSVTSFLIAGRRTLQPFKRTSTQVSLEGNTYIELLFQPDGTVRRLHRGDPLELPETTFVRRGDAFPLLQIPLLVRALDFSHHSVHNFQVLYPDGKHVDAKAELRGTKTLETANGSVPAEEIVVQYTERVPRPAGILGIHAPEETYWRSTDDVRQILRMESSKEARLLTESMQYRLELVEQVRSAWWQENLRQQLTRANSLLDRPAPELRTD